MSVLDLENTLSLRKSRLKFDILLNMCTKIQQLILLNSKSFAHDF